MLENLHIISAGAGSGKTYRLTQELVNRLAAKEVKAAGLIATTFTRKAAAELQERVRVALLSKGMNQEADELANALIGTVHGLGVKLLQRFAYEAGVSPAVSIIAEEDQQLMFNEALATVLKIERVHRMDQLVDRLGLRKRNTEFDWRTQVRSLVEIARANDFSEQDLEKSRDRSFDELVAFLATPSGENEEMLYQRFDREIAQVLQQLPAAGDTTKTTATLISLLQQMSRERQQRGFLAWHQWAKLAKAKPAVKSKEAYEDFQAFCWQHEASSAFRNDIKAYIDGIFDTAREAIHEFDRYKKRRGLIDYTDMEVLVSRLLDHTQVKSVLQDELDLLIVDEFQDTSPIQLAIFLKLSALARESIWVGDPKQSIYGFRGAEPRLMQAIIQQTGGLKPENIQRHSWRSREDIVYACNAIFTQAFTQLAPEQVALEPMRLAAGNKLFPPETEEMGQALIHWHFVPEDEGKLHNKEWMNQALAHALAEWLATRPIIVPKDNPLARPARPGDVAILCRSNRECTAMADALHRAGLAAAIARTGLLQTAEARLILATLKYILQQEDSLSVAEILLLAEQLPLEDIVHDRLEYLEAREAAAQKYQFPRWAAERPLIAQLDHLRKRSGELSGAEILNLVLDMLELRRIVAAWGKTEQRLANLDKLRKMALDYEEACNRLHTAASLGGLLLWFSDQEVRAEDKQGAAESPQSVNILTYHRSKGLEWPVVICHSLEQDIRADVFGFSLVSDREEVDLENILAHRHLRFWVNPYSDQIRATPLQERLEESPLQTEVKQNALAEEIRLLYVGLTRARDYLIFPSRNKALGWLNRVCQAGKSEATTLDEHTHETPWGWKERYLEKKTRIFPLPRIFPSVSIVQENIAFPGPAQGIQEPALPYRINAAEHMDFADFKAVEHIYHPIPSTADGVDAYILGRARKAFLTADRPTYAPSVRLQMAEDILTRYRLIELIDAQQLTDQGNAWVQWRQQHWPGAKVQRLQALRYPQQGRCFTAMLDWVFEMPAKYIIVQNSTYTGEHNKQKLPELAYFLLLAQKGLTLATSKRVERTFVNFINQGRVVEVILNHSTKV